MYVSHVYSSAWPAFSLEGEALRSRSAAIDAQHWSTKWRIGQVGVVSLLGKREGTKRASAFRQLKGFYWRLTYKCEAQLRVRMPNDHNLSAAQTKVGLPFQFICVPEQASGNHLVEIMDKHNCAEIHFFVCVILLLFQPQVESSTPL